MKVIELEDSVGVCFRCGEDLLNAVDVDTILSIQRGMSRSSGKALVRPAFLELEGSGSLVFECSNCDVLGVIDRLSGDVVVLAILDDESYVGGDSND